MRLNRGGLILSVIYTGYFVIALALSATADDPKGGFFLAQLAYLPAAIFLWLSGLASLMDQYVPIDSWLNGPLFFFPLGLVIVYLFGWIMHAIISFKDPSSAPVGEDTPDWHKR